MLDASTEVASHASHKFACVSVNCEKDAGMPYRCVPLQKDALYTGLGLY